MIDYDKRDFAYSLFPRNAVGLFIGYGMSPKSGREKSPGHSLIILDGNQRLMVNKE